MRAAVVGGGVSGLTAALELLERGAEVTLFEASPRLGGALQTHRQDDLLLELGPDSFVRTKPAAIELCERLGVDLVPTRPSESARALIVRDGKLHPLPAGLQLLAPTRVLPFASSPILSWPGKLRAGCDLLLPRRKGATDTDDESLASFVRRRLGSEVLARIAQPLVGGIYSGDPEQLSLRATMPRLLDLERKHRSLILGMRRTVGTQAAGARYSIFLTPRSGMQTLVDALVEAIELGGGRIEVSRPFETLEEISDFDGVVLAVPPARVARLMESKCPPLADDLRSIPTTSSATINFVWPKGVLDRTPEAFGFIVPAVEKRFLMACTFSSRKYEDRSGPDREVLRAYVGGVLGPDVTALSDGELIEATRKDLTQLLCIDSQPEQTLLSRHHRGQPQFVLGHTQRVQRIDAVMEEVPGIELAGNAYQGVGIADCVLSARKAVTRLLH